MRRGPAYLYDWLQREVSIRRLAQHSDYKRPLFPLNQCRRDNEAVVGGVKPVDSQHRSLGLVFSGCNQLKSWHYLTRLRLTLGAFDIAHNVESKSAECVCEVPAAFPALRARDA